MSDSTVEGTLDLAITTVGDLLLNGKLTNRNGLGEFAFDEGEALTIPHYQRPYRWTEKNALRLFDDIVDAQKSNRERYRIGTLILHHNKQDGVYVYDIVDGQQRIITLSLLLHAFDEELDDGAFADGESLDFLRQEMPRSSNTRRNARRNFSTLKRRVGTLVQKEGTLNYIKHNCEFIVVITNELSEAFQFFDSQNTRGKKLYPHDLLKAFHLREMREWPDSDIISTVEEWEGLDQATLSVFFSDYLFSIKRWLRGSYAPVFSERDIQVFKGVNQRNNYPYAQYHKGAYAYAQELNSSNVSFATGSPKLRPFQINATVIAGKPFFEYASNYYSILSDIQNNSKYEGYYINDNEIVKTLDYYYKRHGKRSGDKYARRLFDAAVLLYVDRFCPVPPAHTEVDMEMFDEFVKYAFIWAYSLRAQSSKLSWHVAQNYILGNGNDSKNLKNSFNIFQVVAEAENPRTLLNALPEYMESLSAEEVLEGRGGRKGRGNEPREWDLDNKDKDVYTDYLHWFRQFKFYNDGGDIEQGGLQ